MSKRVPEIRLELDDGILEAARVMTLLDRIEDEKMRIGMNATATAADEEDFWRQIDADLEAEGYGDDEMDEDDIYSDVDEGIEGFNEDVGDSEGQDSGTGPGNS